MATYSSVSANLLSEQTKTKEVINKYINIKNAVKILNNYSNWNGYIKLYTEVQSNFDAGDIVYITYTSPSEPAIIFNLQNPDTPYTEWFNGYTVLYVNKAKNEVVINREYNDITTGKLLNDQYLSKVSVRGGTFSKGVIDGLVFYNSDIYSGVSFTQGIFKYCNISNITFNDKWTTVKVLHTTNNFTSKFTIKKSSTATVYKSKRYYYNIIDHCNLINCNIENGKFDNSILIGTTGVSYINDGQFNDCTISGYTINGGYFNDCIIEANCTWNYGFWNSTGGTDDFRTEWTDGVWNKGNFIGKTWSGGTFNMGTFSASTWVDGVVNTGNFYYATWLNGLVRNGNFYFSTWANGTFNQGNFHDSTWNNGTFNNGTFKSSTYENGLVKGGSFTGATIHGGKWYGGYINKAISISGGSFYQDYVIDNSSLIEYATIHNGNIKNSTIQSGRYYNGYYDTVTFNGSDTIIYNGQYKECALTNLTVNNGNFISCTADNLIWQNGIFTEGYFENGYWWGGTWNDSTFKSDVFAGGDFYGGYFSGDTTSPPTPWTATWSGGTFHYGYWKGVYRTSLPIYPYPKWAYSQQANNQNIVT